MEVEGAASGAPDEESTGEVSVNAAIAPLVVAGIATVAERDSETPVAEEVKEEELDFDPEEDDIVGAFLGTVEVETDEQAPPSSETLPVNPQGAAEGARLETSGSVEASAPAEPDAEPEGVTAGTSPSARSRPARTRGKRGGKDSIYKDYRRVFYQGFEQLKTFLGDHIRPRHGRPGFILQWIP